jgi:glycosyltransferase involved in cell wall biosynthesis
MQILLVTQEYPPYGSGIADAVYRLQTELLKADVRVDILFPHAGGMSVSDAFLKLNGLAGKIPFWQQITEKIYRKAGEYDAVWLHSPLMFNAKKLGIVKKLIVTFHSTYFGFSKAFRTHGIGRLVPYYSLASNIESHFLREISSFRNTILTTVSPSVAEETQENGFLKVPIVVTNGITQESFLTVDREKARSVLLNEFSVRIPKNELVLLYSGRITEVKQPLLLIDLMRSISSFRQDVHLLIAGSGNLLSKSKRKASEFGNVHFLGQLPHQKISIIQSIADAFISLSCYEGLSLSVLESSYFGIPLILSDIPAHSWIIGKRIGHGILVDSNSPSPRKILEFLERLDGRRVYPPTSLLSLFSWKSAAENYLKVLNA